MPSSIAKMICSWKSHLNLTVSGLSAFDNSLAMKTNINSLKPGLTLCILAMGNMHVLAISR
jgi:hypothetical protein